MNPKNRKALSDRVVRAAERALTDQKHVVQADLNNGWTCHRCSGSGGLLMMEPQGPACLRCVGLDDLEFLPPGDALLTRRARAKSQRHAVVVRFGKTRKRYERQGLLVEPQALLDGQQVVERERSKANR